MRFDRLVLAIAIGFVAQTSCHAFTVAVHKDITVKVSNTITAQVRGTARKFSDKAVQEMADANAAVDDGSSQALWNPQRHFTNERFFDSSSFIRTKREEVLTALLAPIPDGAKARKSLGTALHTIQDFHSHSTWWESGNTTTPSNLWSGVIPTNPPVSRKVCTDDNLSSPLNTSAGLTSAYYVGVLGCNAIPAGKCFHGNWTFTSNCADAGINKDRPGTTGHSDARGLAETSTQDFLNGIITELAGNDLAIAALLDLKGSVGFVVDTTGSMANVIAGVRILTQSFVATLAAFPDFAPDQWVLQAFNDPGVGAPLVTNNAAVVSAAIGSLGASGGGDCPELSQAGIISALGVVSPNSRLFVFTDATAKDTVRINEVISLAQATKTQLSYVLSGSCSPVDPAYLRGAAETGGQLYQINRTDTASLQPIIGAQLTGDLVSITTREGTSPSSTVKDVAFPVDSSVTRLVISALVSPSATLTLRRPNGSLVAAGNTGVEIINPGQGAYDVPAVTKIIIVSAPERGQWQVSTVGSGSYAVTVAANSSIALNDFNFVRPGPDLHGGLFPIAGQPQVGATVTAVAKTIGQISGATFQFLTQSGEAFGTAALSNDPAQVGPNEFVGSFSLPNQPFRVALVGADSGGLPFLRQFPTVFRGQPVNVEINGGGTSTITAGVPTPFSFSIRNGGPPATYTIRALSARGFSATPMPTSIVLATGQTVPVVLTIQAPAATPSGTEDQIILTATKSTDNTIFNSAGLALIVSRSGVTGDVTGDGLVNCADVQAVKSAFGRRTGDVGFDPRADLNRDGIINVRDQAIVTQNLPIGTSCP
jgi:von Willebrand factor A domain-containing protein 7